MGNRDSAPVREGEEIAIEPLTKYLRGRLAGAETGIAIEQFPGGHSNLTYLLRAGEYEYVLRRPPLGPVAPKAHDMAREYAVLRAVHPLFPRAPRPFLLCEDLSVIGSVFFVMERRRGEVLRGAAPPGHGDSISAAFVNCLAELHLLPVEGVALGKPAGFLERQVRGWAERWQRAKTDDQPMMNALIRWLESKLPESGPPSIVHNDYKLDNLMLTPDFSKVEAVLDWEMTTVGDPLVDLGCSLCYWTESRDPELRSRAEIVAGYAMLTGRDVSGIGYYEVFGYFKLAVVLQQIYFRYVRGQTRDERFRDLDHRVSRLVNSAFELAGRPA